MMRNIIENTIKEAAVKAGLDIQNIMSLSAADNLTLPRPRIELNFIADIYTRTGKKLAVTKALGVQTIKKELYEISIDVTAQIYADNATWLETFEHDFVVAFPRGIIAI